jgi:hypothetical protein
MTLYAGDRCEGLADENIVSTASSLNKNHIFKLQHSTLYTLPANEIV